jgi:hypothetical protein
LANVQILSEAQLARLAQAGWNRERLAAAGDLVEAYAAADTQHQEQIQLYRTEHAAANNARALLNQWYKQVNHLTKLALRRSDPADQARLQQLLGL